MVEPVGLGDFKGFMAQANESNIDKDRRALLNYKKAARNAASWHTLTTKKFEFENAAKTFKKPEVEQNDEELILKMLCEIRAEVIDDLRKFRFDLGVGGGLVSRFPVAAAHRSGARF